MHSRRASGGCFRRADERRGRDHHLPRRAPRGDHPPAPGPYLSRATCHAIRAVHARRAVSVLSRSNRAARVAAITAASRIAGRASNRWAWTSTRSETSCIGRISPGFARRESIESAGVARICSRASGAGSPYFGLEALQPAGLAHPREPFRPVDRLACAARCSRSNGVSRSGAACRAGWWTSCTISR